MNSSKSLRFLERVLQMRQAMRQDETRALLKVIEENQRAAFLVRLYEQGEFSKVRKLAAVG